jgi:hypothetical protein
VANAAVTPLGRPDAARVTLPVNGLTSVTVMVSVPLRLVATDRVDADGLSVKLPQMMTTRRSPGSHDDAAAVCSQVDGSKDLRVAGNGRIRLAILMCGVIDLSPGDSFVGGGEDAAYAADFSIGKDGGIARSRAGHAEADDIGLLSRSSVG